MNLRRAHVLGRWLSVGCWALALGLARSVHAADLGGCLTLEVKPSGDAVLINGCSHRLNVTYCVDRAQATRNCARKPLDIVTLFPGAADTLRGYVAEGAGPVYWAACVYPEAAVAWNPGPNSPYTCKKTCVMC